MFPRAELKQFAKQRLRFGWGTAVAVTLVASMLGAGISGGSFNLNIDLNEETIPPSVQSWLEALLSPSVLPIVLGVLGSALLVALLFDIFVSNVVTVGLHGWFLRYQRGEEVAFGELFAGFRFYSTALSTRLLTDIYTFLWSLLFLIPGIVKAYAYSMADYLIYENPNLSASRALELSQRMTDGYKGDLFVLDLSWFGWNILNALTGGLLGILYLYPYIHTTEAAVYECLRANALRDGRLTWEDLGQQPPAPPAAPTYEL